MKIAMCSPLYFEVAYELPDNKWMNKDVQPGKNALIQWLDLYRTYVERCVISPDEVGLIEPKKGLPDMVFAANAGLPIPMSDKFILSNFHYKERRKEKRYFKKYFEKHFDVVELPRSVFFEGQGDAVFYKDKLLLGWGFRTSRNAIRELQKHLNHMVVPLELVQPARGDKIFYHLDTCLCHLGDGIFLIFPGAFSGESFKTLSSIANSLIGVSYQDAVNMACNSVVMGKNIIIPSGVSDGLVKKLNDLDYSVVKIDTSEFLKSGGSVRCLTLII